MLNKGKGLISLSQIELGDELFESIEDLLDYVKKLNPDDFRKVTEAIKESDLDPALKSKINSIKPYDDTEIRNKISNLQTFKADKSVVERDYRQKAVFINFNDLDAELQSMIRAVVDGGYDDTELRQQVQNLFVTKLSKIEAEAKYRSKDIAIEKTDLDAHLNSLIDNWEFQDEKIAELEENKADKTQLDEYRKKNVSISKVDLDSNLREIIDNIPQPYDDTHILLVLEELRNTKVDKASMTLYLRKSEAELLYRKLADKITMVDLDEELIKKLQLIPEGFDPTTELSNIKAEIAKLDKNKLDKTVIENVRLKTELIGEADLTEDLAAKVNAISTGYDDRELREAIQNLQSEKLGADVAAKTYRKLSVAIEEEDLSVEVRKKLNDSTYDDSELRNRIRLAEETLKLKENITDVDAKLENYRKNDVKITETDLDEALIDKIEAIRESYDDTEIRGMIADLESEKADKVELNKYKLKDEPVTEDELTQDLRDKINTVANGYDDREVKERISNLEEEMPLKLAKTEAEKIYRNKETKIVETDLDKALKDKINKEFDDQPILDSIEAINVALAKKVDKSTADSTYRFKTQPIDYVDLSEDLKGRIDNCQGGGNGSTSITVDTTAIIENLVLHKLLNIHRERSGYNIFPTNKIKFKRGLFFNQGEVPTSLSPVLFNNDGMICVNDTTHSEEEYIKIRLNGVEEGYEITLINPTGFKEGINIITLLGNGVQTQGYVNTTESNISINVASKQTVSNSVKFSEFYLNTTSGKTLLNTNSIDMGKLKQELKKDPEATITTAIKMHNLKFFIDGENKLLECTLAEEASIEEQSIEISSTPTEMTIKLSEFVKLPINDTYKLVGPSFNIDEVGTTVKPSINISINEETPAEKEIEYEITFILDEGVFDLNVNTLPGWNPEWTLTDEDFYAFETDYLNPKAELQYIGTKISTDKEGPKVKRVGVPIDEDLTDTHNGGYSYIQDSNMYMIFEKANVTARKYRIVKYK